MRWRVSVAVHVTVVVPIGNVLPLTGVQAVVTGDAPLMTDGVPYTSEIGKPVGEICVMAAGQVIVGGSGTGGGGGVGSAGDEQPFAATRTLRRPQTATILPGRNKLKNYDSR